MPAHDGHVRVLPLHVANKIAAGEVVERPASVVKELVENAIDAGARNISIAVTQGGRKLVSVRDDGCGMTRDDALLSLERQATSKILDVDDIERIDTLGFRGEAIPSIASVSRFSLTTRRHDTDEGTFIQVNAGTVAEVRTAGCPPGTLVEVRDLFCNIPARRKFLRSYATEESHVRTVFTVHALAHPEIGFSLHIDGREAYRLAPAPTAADRIRELFGKDFSDELLALTPRRPPTNRAHDIRVSGFIERPNLATPSRRDQYVFVNGRPATASSIAYALREAYPRRPGEVRPAAVIFIELPPSQVDVNVHPTKREVRFRDNTAVKEAIVNAVEGAIDLGLEPQTAPTSVTAPVLTPATAPAPAATPAPIAEPPPAATVPTINVPTPKPQQPQVFATRPQTTIAPELPPTPVPTPIEFAIDPDSTRSRPWKWFKFLAQTDSGYLLIETDAGLVTVNPYAARERIAYEHLLDTSKAATSQTLLIPEIVRLSPVDFSRVSSAIDIITMMGFALEPFGRDTFKIDAVPQLTGTLAPAAILTTIARDLSESPSRHAGQRWREEMIAKSIARSFAGSALVLTAEGAVKLIEELCSCRMPYVCPRGKPVMIFTSTRELDRKFDRI